MLETAQLEYAVRDGQGRWGRSISEEGVAIALFDEYGTSQAEGAAEQMGLEGRPVRASIRGQHHERRRWRGKSRGANADIPVSGLPASRRIQIMRALEAGGGDLARRGEALADSCPTSGCPRRLRQSSAS